MKSSYIVKLGLTLLTIFIVSYFLHLSSRYPMLGAVRFDFMLGGMILLCVLLARIENKGRQLDSIYQRLKIFFLYILLSLPLVTWPGSVLRFHLIDWIKVALFFIFLVTLVRTPSQLRWVFGVFVGCQVIRILEPLYLHLTLGYWGSRAYSMIGGDLSVLRRLSGAPSDVVNPNQLAWIIVSMVPFIFYLLWKGGRLGKILAFLAAPSFIYCLILTGSRSGLLCLGFVLLVMVFLSKPKFGNLMVVSVIAITSGILLFGSINSDLQTRYLSIIDSSVAGADTAQGRIDSWFRALDSISHNPLFGNGLGTSREVNFNVVGGSPQITHNLYLEVLQETGLIGFILFMLFIAAIFKGLMETKRLLFEQGREGDWLFRLATATQAWVIMDLFYSLSCFGLHSWEWYFFGGIATVCLVLAREQAAPQAIVERSTFGRRSTLKLTMSGRRA